MRIAYCDDANSINNNFVIEIGSTEKFLVVKFEADFMKDNDSLLAHLRDSLGLIHLVNSQNFPKN